AMGLFGLVLAGLYAAFVNERKLARHRIADEPGTGPGLAAGRKAKPSTLFSTPSVLLAYIGGGLQLFIAGSLFAWLPSYLNRTHGMAPDRAAGVAALIILVMGAGMIICGVITVRVSRTRPIPATPAERNQVAMRKWTVAIAFAALPFVLLGTAFSLPPGGAQLLLIAVGAFFAAGT